MVRTKNLNIGGEDQRDEPQPKQSRAEATARFAKKQAVQERQFPPTKEFGFYDKAVAMGFEELLKKRNRANLSLVREFYISSAAAGELRFSSRNKDFGITVEDIRRFYKLPVVENCQFKRFKINLKRVDWEEAFKVIGVEGAGWTTTVGKQYFERKNMNEEAKVWLNFMNYNVRPAAHISTIPVEATLLLYLLMTEQPLDVATIARDQIMHCINSTRTSMIFPHLISDLCTARRTEEKKSDIYLSPVTTRIFSAPKPTPGASSSQSRKKGKRIAVEAPEEEEEEAEEGESAITMKSLSEQIAALQQIVNANEFRRQQFIDPLTFKTAQALNIAVPPGFEHAFWQNSIPSSTYFPGQSSGVEEEPGAAEEEAGTGEMGGGAGEEGLGVAEEEEDAGADEGGEE